MATEIDRHLPWLIRVAFRAFRRAQTPEQGAARASGPNGFTVPDFKKRFPKSVVAMLQLEATVAYCMAADVVSGGFYAQCALTDLEGRRA